MAYAMAPWHGLNFSELTNIHTYIHIMHRYIHTHTHRHIMQLYIHTHVQTHNACKHTYTYIHTYIHTYLFILLREIYHYVVQINGKLCNGGISLLVLSLCSCKFLSHTGWYIETLILVPTETEGCRTLNFILFALEFWNKALFQ